MHRLLRFQAWLIGLLVVAGFGQPGPLAAQALPSGQTQPVWWWRNPPQVNLPGSVLTWPYFSSLAIDSADPDLIYAGTGSSEAFSTTMAVAAGVYRSQDGGKTWSVVFNLSSGLAGAWVVAHPTTANLVFAGVSRNFFAAGAGLYRSADGGQTWSPVVTDRSFVSLDVSPADPNRVYAVFNNNGQPSRVWMSTDAGVTWAERSMTGGTITASPFDPNEVYLASEALTSVEPIRRSLDGGQTWSPVQVLVNSPRRLVLHPADRNRQYVLTVGTGPFWFTDDGGEYWFRRYPPRSATAGAQASVTMLKATASAPNELWALSSEHGPMRSLDDGQSWDVRARGLNLGPSHAGGGACTELALAADGPHAVLCGGRVYVQLDTYTLFVPAVSR